MRGGSLKRYHTPELTQRGAGLAEQLLKIAGPSIIQAAKNTLSDVQQGKSLQASAKQHGKQLTRTLKRKAPRMVLAAGTHATKQKYKKATRRIKDIFSL